MKLSERYTIAGSYFLKQVRRQSGKVMVAAYEVAS